MTNGSMQADAFLFDALVEPGRLGRSSSARPTTARCCRCASAAPTCGWSSSRTDGIDVAAVERVLAAGAKPKLAHIIPNFQNPAGYTLSAPKREQLLALAREYEFTVFEDDPYVALRFEGDAAGDDALDGRRQRRLRVVVLEDRLPRDPRRLPRRADGADRPDRQDRDQHVHLAEHGGAVDRLQLLHARGRSSARSRPSRRRCASAPQTLCEALRAKLPDARFVEPQGGYFLWVDLPRGTDVGAMFSAAAERGVAFVKGTDFVLEGGESSLRLAYSGRHARADRRGRRPARGRLPRGDVRRHCRSGPRTSGRSARGRARAAREARCAAAATGRRSPRRSRRRSR